MNIFRRLKGWFKKAFNAITPGKVAVRGAAIGLLFVAILLWLLFALLVYIKVKDAWLLLFGLVMILLAALTAFLVRWLIKQLYDIPSTYKLSLLISLPLLIFISFDWKIALIIVLIASLCGAAIWTFKKTTWKGLSWPKRVIALLGLLVGFGGLIAAGIIYNKLGYDEASVINAAKTTGKAIANLNVVSPAQQGNYSVKTISYGSGKDLHRPEYGDEVSLTTETVNGVAFIDNWKGVHGWFRERYWGFDDKELPLNAKVWYPEGDGPFPLVLIVHGNHMMQDYSEGGYAYLGELLASKGIIVASVDQNFINGSWSNLFGSLEKENDARGWLLLEHLKVWHQWNDTANHLFYQKIDTNNIALMGHSRGGEAVAHAALFNKLPYYPDDASVVFDFNYNIKSIVAIAPVDGQYEPSKRRTALENINYFVIHGSHDADVKSYMGSQQYERVKFTNSAYYFKSGLYVYGANHGQFNTNWGNNDIGNPFSGILNLKPLMPLEEQLEIAKVYIGAFLDITLKNNTSYLPLFADARTGKDWLPETIYLNQFEDATFKAIASFDEDFNLATTTLEGGEIIAENLSVWREQEIQLKWQQKGSRALYAGWYYDLEPSDTIAIAVPDSLLATYSIRLPQQQEDSTAVLVFAMAESNEDSNPKASGKWVANSENNIGNNTPNTINNQSNINESNTIVDKTDKESDDEETAKTPIDFTIQLTDAGGETVAFYLSRFSALQRTLEVTLFKVDGLLNEKESERVFQTFYYPLEGLRELNYAFDITHITDIRFIFDKSSEGVVIIDNIGFTTSISHIKNQLE
jgi:dienelactone hydrolase